MAVTREEKLSLLSGVPLFGGLSDGELTELLQVTRTRALKAREELFHKGDEGTEVYLVVRGTLKALTTSDEGDDVVFTILGPGELFGIVNRNDAWRMSSSRVRSSPIGGAVPASDGQPRPVSPETIAPLRWMICTRLRSRSTPPSHSRRLRLAASRPRPQVLGSLPSSRPSNAPTRARVSSR